MHPGSAVCSYRLPLCSLLLFGATEVIVQTHDVVFAEIAAPLHFDEYEQFVSRVFNSMSCANGNADRLTTWKGDVFTVESNFGYTFDYNPVLSALRMLLVAQPFAGQHLNALDLVIISLIEHSETSPRPLVEFR